MDSEREDSACFALKPVKSMFRSWTDAEDKQLRDYLLEQFTRNEIAVRLSRSKAAVARRVYKLGLNRPKGEAHAIAAKMEGILRAKSNVTAGWMNGDSQPARPLEIHTPKPNKYSCGLFELTRATCRWPCGNPAELDFFYCGKPTHHKKVYCKAHCVRAYSGFDPKL